jgi:hypothetical protein
VYEKWGNVLCFLYELSEPAPLPPIPELANCLRTKVIKKITILPPARYRLAVEIRNMGSTACYYYFIAVPYAVYYQGESFFVLTERERESFT